MTRGKLAAVNQMQPEGIAVLGAELGGTFAVSGDMKLAVLRWRVSFQSFVHSPISLKGSH